MAENIIADGYEIAVTAIRAQVKAEFAERLRAATFWQRIGLRRLMRAEIKRRIQKQAPADALYTRQDL